MYNGKKNTRETLRRIGVIVPQVEGILGKRRRTSRPVKAPLWVVGVMSVWKRGEDIIVRVTQA